MLIYIFLIIIIYYYYGILVLLQIVIWSLVFFISNLINGINPNNNEIRIIRILSIIVIIFSLWYNSGYTEIISAIIVPLSIDKISYAKDFKLSYDKDLRIITDIFYLWDNWEVKNFLSMLDDDTNYIVSMEFIPTDEIVDVPHLILCEPFLINQHSSSTTIRKFILERLNKMVDCFYLDDSIIQPVEDGYSPFIILKFSKIHLR
jgi:hypothetical protein